jgi:tetratricopeptide (TPR) repeat protein
MYLLVAMAGTINIGVRHLLPMLALLAVGTASQFSLGSRRIQLCAWLGAGWLFLATWQAYPHFIEYFNELAVGPSNGYRWLLDSNLDWGQDVKRLKRFLDQRAITNIDLAYFGPGHSIDYYQITSRPMGPGEAAGIHSGTLVVSATDLMNPGWDWLRASHEPVARVGYTMFVYRLGDAETKERWEQMLRINPDDARAHYNLGLVLERAGDAAGAIGHFEQAIRIKPDFSMAHYNLALALQQAGRTEDAIAHFQQVLRIEPDVGEDEVHYQLGGALAQTGQIEEAIAHYQQDLRINPEDTEAHYYLGTALAQVGRVPEAIVQYQQALWLQPDFTAARNALARLRARP